MENQDIKTYYDWAFEGKKSIVRYIIGFLFVIIMSLYVGQVFVVASNIIPVESPAIKVFKLTFFGFILSFIAIPIVISLLHRRPWWSIAMPRKQIEFKNFFIGFGIVLAINFVSTGIDYMNNPGSYLVNKVNYPEWALLFFLALISFFIQATTEEMVYRGYISQFVYRMTKQPIVAILISSLIFAYPHIGNISGVSGIYAVLPYAIAGLGYGWLAYRSGSLWMSIGAHMANNWFITMFFGSGAEKLDKLSLFTKIDQSNSPSQFTTSALLYYSLIILLAEIAIRITKRKPSH